jgi:hypothetical protein
LLAKLSGVVNPPKARQAFQQYMHESYEADIAPVVARRWAAQSVSEDGKATTKKKPGAPFRSMVACELFAALPDDTKDAI